MAPYNLDWVCGRAAWLLEKLTFQDFGYQDRTITEAKLLALHKQGYQFYLANCIRLLDFKDKTPRERLKIYRLGQSTKVAAWWNKQPPMWTGYAALIEALASADE